MKFPIKISPNIASQKEVMLVFENFLSLFSMQSLGYVLPIIVLPYLVRTIGPEKFGLIAFAQAFVQYFMILTDYGFSLSATKKISMCQDEKEKLCEIFSSVMSVKILLSAVSFVVLIMFVRFIPKFRNDWMVFVLSYGAVIGNTLFPLWFFQGKEKMRYIAIINIIGGIIYAASIFIFVKAPHDYLYVPLLNSLFFLVTGYLGLRLAFRKFGLFFTLQSYKNIRQELKAGWDIFISTVAINAYTTSRVFVVGLLTNNTTTGYYAIAEKIANFIQTFPLASFSQAVFPRINKIFAKNKQRAIRVMNKAQDITTATGIVCLPVIFLFTPQISRMICGCSYPEVVLSLRLLIFSVFIISANAFKIQFLIVCGKADLYARIHVAMAVAGLPLLFLLINQFSYTGAAVATIIIEAGTFILTFIALRKLLYTRL